MQVLLVDDDVHAIVLVVARRPLALLALLPACGRLVLERRFLRHGRTSAQPHIPAGRFTASCSSAIQRLLLLVHNSCHEDPARDDGFKGVFLSAGERASHFHFLETISSKQPNRKNKLSGSSPQPLHTMWSPEHGRTTMLPETTGDDAEDPDAMQASLEVGAPSAHSRPLALLLSASSERPSGRAPAARPPRLAWLPRVPSASCARQARMSADEPRRGRQGSAMLLNPRHWSICTRRAGTVGRQ